MLRLPCLTKNSGQRRIKNRDVAPGSEVLNSVTGSRIIREWDVSVSGVSDGNEVIGQTIIFSSCFFLLSFFFLLFFPRLISAVGDGCLPYFGTWCGPSANLECRSEMRCTRLAANTGRKKSPKIAISAPSHNFVGPYLRN